MAWKSNIIIITGLLQVICASSVDIDVSTTRIKISSETQVPFEIFNKAIQKLVNNILNQSGLFGQYSHDINISNNEINSGNTTMLLNFRNVSEQHRLAICKTIHALSIHSEIDLNNVSFIEITSLDCCIEERAGEEKLRGTYLWPTSLVGRNVSQICCFGGGNATRFCTPSFRPFPNWEKMNEQQCHFFSKSTTDLMLLSKINANQENVNENAENLLRLTTKAATNGGNEYDYNFASVALQNFIEVNFTSNQIGKLHFQTANQLLNFDRSAAEKAENNFKSSKRIRSSLELLAANMEYETGQSSFVFSSPNTGLLITQITLNAVNLLEGVTIATPPFKVTGGNFTVNITDGRWISDSRNATIYLPASLLLRVFNIDKGTSQRLVSFVYRTDLLFPNKFSEQISTEMVTNNITLDSVVMSASFPGKIVRGLTEPMESYFQSNNDDAKRWRAMCGFWKEDSPGLWSTDGCRLISTENDIYGCECDHLTNFAILVDLSDPADTGTSPLELLLITYIGCGVSMASLVLTLLTMLLFPDLYRKLPPRILICLCISLLALLVVFVVGIERTSHRLTCQIFAFFLHYFVLTTFCWMLVEGYNLYLCFVKIIGVNNHKVFLKANLFAWITPAIIVSVTSWREWRMYGNDKNCMLHGKPFYFALLAPIGLILLINIIILYFVLVCIRRGAKLTRTGRNKGKSQLRIAFACSIILGLTWTSAVFAIGSLRYPFQLVFSITNSLQGFFIFSFYCVKNPEVRKSWKKALGIKDANEAKGSFGTRRRQVESETNTSRSDKKKKTSNCVRNTWALGPQEDLTHMMDSDGRRVLSF